MPRAHRRVFGYARVSSEEQARGSSLRDQQDSIASYAKSLGLKVTKFFVEAESAVFEKIEKREQIQSLLRTVASGDLVVVDKVDRWSRDPEFTYRSVREIRAAGANVFFVAERLDPATTEGDTALGFRILFAREEHKRIRERMIGTRNRLVDQGYYAAGATPIGYRRPHPPGYKGVEKNVLAVHSEEAAIVRRIFMLAAAGKSLSQIAERLDIKRDLAADVLHNRVYLGEVKNSEGVWIKGKHAAVLDGVLFQRAQEGLLQRKLGGARARDAPSETDAWILRDVAVCALCGHKMSSAYAGPHDARRYYYRCFRKCTTRFVPVRLVEAAFEPLVLARLAELRELLGREPPKKTMTKVPDTSARQTKLTQRRARYLEMYADGVMTRDAMLGAVGRVDAELMRLTTPAAPVPTPKLRRTMLRELDVLEKAWRRAPPKLRREVVNNLASSVGLAQDELPLPVWRSPEDLLGSDG